MFEIIALVSKEYNKASINTLVLQKMQNGIFGTQLAWIDISPNKL